MLTRAEIDTSLNLPLAGVLPAGSSYEEADCTKGDGSLFTASGNMGTISAEVLRRSERLAGIGLMTAGIAHEINNPIGSARLAAETALAVKDLPEGGGQLTACLENVVASMDRCGRIVRTLLRFCRDEPPEKASCSINNVAKRAADATRFFAERQKLAIRLECDPEVPPVPMNPLEIELVLENLLRNALAAGGSEAVVLRTGQIEGAVRASVCDNGRGMNRRQLTHAFDPLYTTRVASGGCGLGLSIARRIIQRHQGRMILASREGQGTLVTIDLPKSACRGKDLLFSN
jgi:two-component system, NtrC family, sensor kinase